MKAIRKLNILLAVWSFWSMIDLFLNIKVLTFAKFRLSRAHSSLDSVCVSQLSALVSSGPGSELITTEPSVTARSHRRFLHNPSCPVPTAALARSKGTSNYDVEIHRNNDCPMFIFIVLSTLHFWTFNCTLDSTLSTFKLYPNHYSLLCLWSAYQ